MVLLGLTILAPAAVAAEAHTRGSVVFLNNVPVLMLKAGTADQRAAAANLIAKILRTVDDEDEVTTRETGGDYQIRIGSVNCADVSAAEASAHRVSAEHLAESWASTIRDALSLPPLKFSSDALRLPLGTIKDLSLVGSLAYTAVVSSSNEAVVRVRRLDSGVEINCIGVGDAEVQALSGNSLRRLEISIRPYAGLFPQSFAAEVSGTPALAATVKGAVEACIKTRVVCLPTATYAFQPVTAEPLGPGRTGSYTVRVHLRAPDSFDSEGNVSVTVRNTPVSKAADCALWYSNAPESVKQIGPLFSSSLKTGAPVRFLYHHIDASSQPMILRVEAINDSDQTARLLIVPGDSKPDKNPVRAGMTAACQFLKAWPSDSADIVPIPAHSTLPLSVRRLSPSETASGLCELRLLSGPSELQVRTDALPPFDLQGSWYDASLSSTPWREAGSHPINDYDRALSEPSPHVYPDPYKNERIDYTVGGRYGFLLLGQKPISGEDHTNNLDGNFGVIYNIKASVQNPTDSPTDVDLIFEASAGYMGGIFLVDGNLIQTPLLTPKMESRLMRIHLAKGADRTLNIVTLPISGGSYPATLYLRPVDVIASVHRASKGRD